jgi:hypothetical protein
MSVDDVLDPETSDDFESRYVQNIRVVVFAIMFLLAAILARMWYVYAKSFE